MTKKTKTRLNMAEKSDKGKDQNEDQRGLIVETGTPLWQRNGRKRHIQFKAGKMYVLDNMVHPDPRKGYICIDQDYEHVMHFCWMERDAVGIKEDDLTPDPYDSIFKRVTKCTTGRVYVLKIRSTNKNYFFWMQEPTVEKDSEVCAKVNYLLNFPPPWLRFPHIACNLEVPDSPSDETSLYSSTDESNTSDQPAEPTEGHKMIKIENSQTFHKILESELPGRLQSYKKKFASRTSDVPTPELRLTFQDVPENISTDSVGLLMEDSNFMKRLAGFLPILEDGEKDRLDDTVKPKSFENEMSAFANAVRRNGGLEQMMRNLGSAETSVGATDDELSSDDSEYADAENWENRGFKQSYYSNKRSDQGKTRHHDPWDHNINKLVAALVMNVKEKLKCGITEGLSTNTHQQTYNDPRKQCQQMGMVVPTGSNGNYHSECKSTCNKGSTSLPKIDLNRRGTENYRLEKWESATDPNFGHNQCETANCTQTDGSVIYKRTLSMESSCGCARLSVQSSYTSLVGNEVGMDVGNTIPTSSNRNHDGDGKSIYDRESSCGKSIHLSECKTTHSLENLTSAIEPNFHLKHNERETTNTQMEDYMIYERIGASENRNYDRERKSLDNTESASGRDIHIKECETEKLSLERWTSAAEPNFNHETQVNLPQTKGDVMDERIAATFSNGNYDRCCNSISEPNVHFSSPPENWRAASGSNFYSTCNERETGNNNQTEYNSIHGSSTTSRFKCSSESLRKKIASVVNQDPLHHVFPKVMTLQTALVTEACSEMGEPSDTTEVEEDIEVTQTTQSPEVSESRTALKSLCSTESRSKNTSVDGEAPPQGLPEHVCPKIVTLQTATGTSIAHSELGDPSNISDKEGEKDVKQTVDNTPVRSGERYSSNLQFNQEKTPVDGGLGKPDESQSILCVSIGVGTTFMQSSSPQNESQLECSAREPASSVTPRMANPNRSGSRGVDVGCGTRSGKRLPPLKLEDMLAQPGCSKLWNPMLFESFATDTQARESVISMLPSKTSTLSGYYQETEDDDASKETADLSKPGTSILGDTDRVTSATQEIANPDSSHGEVLDENYDTMQDEKSLTNTIAMVVLSTGGKNVNADVKQANKTLGSCKNESLLESAEMDVTTQATKETRPGSASNTNGETATSSRQGLQNQELAKPNHHLSEGQKTSNRTVPEPKNAVSKKTVANNLPISKSLEDVIYVSGSNTEGRYNLRKRPQQRVDVSLSGPIMNASPTDSGKRLRTSSPGVPLPSPFRVPEASTVGSKRSRYPQTSGSAYLRTPNQEGRGSRKRPNDDVDSSGSEEEAPPMKKSRISNAHNSPSKAGPSRQPRQSSASAIKTPATGSGGTGSTLGRSPNRPSRAPMANHSASKGSSQIADSSPRYNLRRRSDPVKTEDEQQTEPVRIREIRKTGPETRVRARTSPQSAIPRVQRVDRSIRDQSQNTRPVLIEDKKGSKSKTKDQKPSQSDENPKP